MTPRIPNSKEPWKIDSAQIQDLDQEIKRRFPTARISEGVKYGRWAELDGFCKLSLNTGDPYAPDNVFNGTVFGREVTILMWLPFFS